MPTHVPLQELGVLQQVSGAGSGLVRGCPHGAVQIVMEKLPLSLPQTSPLLLKDLNPSGPQTSIYSLKNDLLQVASFLQVQVWDESDMPLSVPATCNVRQKLQGFPIIGCRRKGNPVICGLRCTQIQSLETVLLAAVHPLHEALSSSGRTCWTLNGSGA